MSRDEQMIQPRYSEECIYDFVLCQAELGQRARGFEGLGMHRHVIVCTVPLFKTMDYAGTAQNGIQTNTSQALICFTHNVCVFRAPSSCSCLIVFAMLEMMEFPPFSHQADTPVICQSCIVGPI